MDRGGDLRVSDDDWIDLIDLTELIPHPRGPLPES
ncbi:hypothetical protein Actkin_05817 [Actinokineospora sp. UTMC 2448]|nr:hypothetical protein Actkin_05817 [Actinokineospora sp. UTMC 2448]